MKSWRKKAIARITMHAIANAYTNKMIARLIQYAELTRRTLD